MTQVNVREYYNSKTPRVGSHKSKTPSQSPSMEPINHIQPTADQSITYASVTQTTSPQNHSTVNPERPTTPTMSNTPATETTLHMTHTIHFSPHKENEEDFYTEDLLSHSKMIRKFFLGNTLISALPDIEYFHAKVNMLSTKDFEGNVQNSVKIHGELMEYILGYDKLCHPSPPCWLGNQGYLDAKSHPSIVFSFTTTEDRDKFIAFSPNWVFNQCCTITRYKDHPHIFTC